MPSDDPISQVKFLIESDERQRSAGSKVVQGILKLCLVVPFLREELSAVERPLDMIADMIQGWREENALYLLDVLVDEVQSLNLKIENISKARQTFIQNDWLKLVIEGAARAQQTRAKERVAMLAKVLAYAFNEGERRSPNTTEEMMRVALSVDREDILVLSWLCDGVKEDYIPASGQVNHEAVNSFWGQVDEQGRTRSSGEPAAPAGLSPGDLMSACAKLQAFGLVVQVRPNQFKVSPGTLPYGPLKKGYEFLDYLRAESRPPGTAI